MPDNENEQAEEVRVVEADEGASTTPVINGQVAHQDAARRERDPEHRQERAQARDRDAPRRDRDGSRRVEDGGDEDYGERARRRINQFRRRAGDAEARAAHLEVENRRLMADIGQLSETALEHYDNSAKARLDAAEREAREAYESGDGQLIVQANRKLASAQNAVDNVEAVKARAKREVQSRPETGTEGAHEQGRTSAEQPRRRFSEKTEEWISDNSWFDQDHDARDQAIRIHKRMVDQGYAPESQEYFEELTRRCRAMFPEHYDEGEQRSRRDDPENEQEEQPRRGARDEREPPRRPTAPPVGAVSRTTAGGKRVTEVRLTAEQREAASIAGISVKEYAENLLKLRANGKVR